MLTTILFIESSILCTKVSILDQMWYTVTREFNPTKFLSVIVYRFCGECVSCIVYRLSFVRFSCIVYCIWFIVYRLSVSGCRQWIRTSIHVCFRCFGFALVRPNVNTAHWNTVLINLGWYPGVVSDIFALRVKLFIYHS